MREIDGQQIPAQIRQRFLVMGVPFGVDAAGKRRRVVGRQFLVEQSLSIPLTALVFALPSENQRSTDPPPQALHFIKHIKVFAALICIAGTL